MQCDVCNHEFTIEGFYGGCCPKCGQEYGYDEGMMLVLSDEQKEVLRKHALGTISEWKVLYNYAAYRELNGERIAFIEKTPRVKHPTTNEWIDGPKGDGGGTPEKDGTYGFCKESREWCDAKLVELGYAIPKE